MRGCDDAAVESVTVYLEWVDGSGSDDGLRRRARSLALDAAAAALGQPRACVVLRAEPGGRPVLEVAGRLAPGLHVGISHARCPTGARSGVRGVVAVALSRLGPVGVDIEVVRNLPALALARRWLTAAETTWLERRPEPQRTAAFLLLWTQKEAVGKAMGVGLRGGGLRRALPLPRGEARSWFVSGQARHTPTVRLRPTDTPQPMAAAAWLHDDLALAVACMAESAVTIPVMVRRVGQEGVVDR